MTIGVLLYTYDGDRHLLPNLFNSLQDAEINEVCILDSSKEYDKDFHEWLYNQIEHVAPIGKVRHTKLQMSDHQVEARNELINISESDWLIALDSDEMLTIEAAKNLKHEIDNLPEHVSALRMKKLSLIDDSHCLEKDLWTDERPPKGHHPQVFKRGSKFIAHPAYKTRHPILMYPGRDEVPYDSPMHPCKDWNGYYMIHLWLYNNMASKWANEKWKRKEEDDKVIKGNSADYLKQRDWKIRELPKIVTWRKITL